MSGAGPWALDYIEDAATHREIIRFRDGRICDASASNYNTPTNGVHLCGQTDDGEQPTTVATYPMRPVEATALFEIARSVAECSKGEEDFIVDLCLADDITDDFYSNRQLWPRAIAAWNEAVPLPTPAQPLAKPSSPLLGMGDE